MREGYGALSAQAKRQLAVVAAVRGSQPLLGARDPGRAPMRGFLLNAGRIGSCVRHVNDFVCNFVDPWNFPWAAATDRSTQIATSPTPAAGSLISRRARSPNCGLLRPRCPLRRRRPSREPASHPCDSPRAAGPLRRYRVRQSKASSPGPRLSPGAVGRRFLQVDHPAIASVNPDGYWYRIASAPWNDQYYAAANTFMNGDPWGGPFRHPTDHAVPTCSGANTTPHPATTNPAGRSDILETTSGPINTCTNDTNAGGTQGPTIPANTTVQIACKLTGFKVANGNTLADPHRLEPVEQRLLLIGRRLLQQRADLWHPRRHAVRRRACSSTARSQMTPAPSSWRASDLQRGHGGPDCGSCPSAPLRSSESCGRARKRTGTSSRGIPPRCCRVTLPARPGVVCQGGNNGVHARPRLRTPG